MFEDKKDFKEDIWSELWVAANNKAIEDAKREGQKVSVNSSLNYSTHSPRILKGVALNHVKSNRKKSGESNKNLTQNRSLMRAEKWDWI